MSYIGSQGPDGEVRDLHQSQQGSLHTMDRPLQYLNDEHVTSSDGTANALNPPAGAVHATLHIRAADIYFDYGGGSTTPASGQGDEAFIGDRIVLGTFQQMERFRAVRQASANFTIKVMYYQENAALG
jgi:hypothetical protein